MTERTKYLRIFKGEAEEHLNSLRDGLLMLEGSPADSGLLLRVMRNAHTLKGTSRMMGFPEIGDVAHRMEDTLKEAERDPQILTDEVVSVLLSAADYIREVLGAVGAKEEAPPVPEELLNQLGSLVPGQAAAAGTRGRIPEGLGESLQAILAGSGKEGMAGLGVKSAEEKGKTGKRGKTSVVINLDRNLDTIRVDVPVLDRLTDLVGELSINRAKLGNKIHQARAVSREAGALVESVPKIRRANLKWKQSAQNLADRMDRFVQDAVGDLDEMTQILREIQDETLQMRMLPISLVLDDFHRLVREEARRAGKVVEFTVDGGDTKVDKKVLEEIVSPLIHMVTNAIDHGIELPQDRVAAGKDEVGHLRVRVTTKGDHASLEIRDDGQGLDPETLRAVAVAKAFLTPEEAGLLSDEAAYHLIFRSGFTTREKASGTSGRGVGMDVVRANVEALKGDIRIESSPGKFTSFTLTLPLNYSILQALILECGGEVAVLPLDFVAEILRADRGQIIRHGGRSRMPYDGGTISLVELGPLLGYPRRRPVEGDRLEVVVLACRGEKLGVSVDRILRREEVVVKSVGGFLQGMVLVSGATILRLGDPAIILNVFDLFDVARTSRAEVQSPKKSRGPSRLLVVDDSITARTVEKGILEKAGYQVDLASNGEEALEKVRMKQYDLVVTDVEMPGKDGFELTASLKQDPVTREIPVVIVTTREEGSERRKGAEAGARAYITKGAFDEDTLLETIRRLIG